MLSQDLTAHFPVRSDSFTNVSLAALTTAVAIAIIVAVVAVAISANVTRTSKKKKCGHKTSCDDKADYGSNGNEHVYNHCNITHSFFYGEPPTRQIAVATISRENGSMTKYIYIYIQDQIHVTFFPSSRTLSTKS